MKVKNGGSPPTLLIEGPRATIQLNRPAVMNRIEADDLTLLLQFLDQVDGNRTLRVLVLTATGPAFSAGFDLRAFGGNTDTGRANAFEALADRLETVSIPTICRLNGGVYGGATDLALACDFRIAVIGTELVMPAARIGLHYYRGGLARFVSRLGVGAAKRLFLTAGKLTTAELLRIGYLDAAVPAGELDGHVDALAASLAANAPRAVAGMKRSLNDIARGGYDPAVINARHQASLGSAEVREGTAAFREKRAPRFD